MSKLAILLRGINVGGNNKVAMADLKKLLAGLDYGDPRTLLNSGNAVVDTGDSAAAAEKRVRAAVKAELGLQLDVMARTHRELTAVLEANPLRDVADKPNYYVVGFLAKKPAAGALSSLDMAAYAPECWKLVGRELYIWYANGQAKTKLTAGVFEKQLKVAMTARNWNTVQKLAELTAP